MSTCRVKPPTDTGCEPTGTSCAYSPRAAPRTPQASAPQAPTARHVAGPKAAADAATTAATASAMAAQPPQATSFGTDEETSRLS
ncbi:hypothetical protein [Tsukamurella tyrosinosolvens]|uniref:hypothetical protein n=1 Tax=Tsukamurella tyrosinosolvens TaxID=57704 RepID=UPI00125F6BCB|nr:hypothetical protein [Tsukamurella tyrosinosolvens]